MGSGRGGSVLQSGVKEEDDSDEGPHVTCPHAQAPCGCPQAPRAVVQPSRGQAAPRGPGSVGSGWMRRLPRPIWGADCTQGWWCCVCSMSTGHLQRSGEAPGGTDTYQVPPPPLRVLPSRAGLTGPSREETTSGPPQGPPRGAQAALPTRRLAIEGTRVPSQRGGQTEATLTWHIGLPLATGSSPPAPQPPPRLTASGGPARTPPGSGARLSLDGSHVATGSAPFLSRFRVLSPDLRSLTLTTEKMLLGTPGPRDGLK